MKKILQPVGILSIALAFLFGGCQEDSIELVFTGSVQGWVVTEGYDSLANVIITTNPASESTTTDESGFFFLENIPVGEYTIRANKEGYREEVTNISVLEEDIAETFLVLSRIPDENLPPTAAYNPGPADGATGLPLSVGLSWEASDVNERDTLRYSILLFSDDVPEGLEVASKLDTNFFQLEDLAYATDYAWQVITDDGNASPVYGELWTFRTEPFPDLPIHFVRKENDRYVIYGMDTQDRLARLTDGQQDCWRPRMSPNRDKIAFLSTVDGDVHLFSMDPDGKNVRQITPAGFPVGGHKPFELDFCWSPFGDRLLYMHFDKLYWINRDGTGLTEVATAPAGQVWVEVDMPALGQGDLIAARTRSVLPYESRIFLLRSEDAYAPQIILGDVPGATGGPALYINGARMLLTIDVSGNEVASGRQLDTRIHLLTVGAGQLSDLSEDKIAGTNDLDPRYDPTGAQVIFVNTPNTLDSGRRDLWIMDETGGNRTLLIEDAEMPDWR